MGEIFKNDLDSFLKEILIKIEDQSLLSEFQKKYEDLIDNCNFYI